MGLDCDDVVRDLVCRARIEIPGRTPAEVVAQLKLLPSLRDEPLLLREVSARLFWGLSKVLDKRQALVAALLGLDECPFPEMPVQLQAWLPGGGFEGAAGAGLDVDDAVVGGGRVVEHAAEFEVGHPLFGLVEIGVDLVRRSYISAIVPSCSG